MTPLVPLLVASCCKFWLTGSARLLRWHCHLHQSPVQDFAIFAIVALLHNVLITVGIFSFWVWWGVEVDSLFIVLS